MKTFKKLFSVSAIVALLGTLAPMYAFGATYSDELNDAYDYAYAKGVTTMTSIDNANMYGDLTRIAMAKMIANYATTVLGLTPDTSATCTFSDVTASLDAQYDNGVTNACQLGLMGQNITAFRPDDPVTRGEFGTTLSRALNANSDDLADMNKADPYYKEHLAFLKSEGIMKDISNPAQKEVRGYVMLMMMRADDSYTPATRGCTAEELLACVTADDYDACIAACSDAEAEEEDLPGYATVSTKAAAAQTVALNAVDKKIGTVTLKAGENDSTITALEITKSGLGDPDNVDSISLMKNGEYVTNAAHLKNNVAKLTFRPSLSLKANGSETFDVVVTMKANGGAGGIHDFSVTSVTVSNGTFGGTPAKLGSLTTTNYTIQGLNVVIDDSEADAGDKDVEVLSVNLASPNTDATVTALTLIAENSKDSLTDIFTNVKAYIDDEVVGTVKLNEDTIVVNGLNENIKKGKDVDVVIKADVIYVGNMLNAINFDAEHVVATEDNTSERMPLNVTKGSFQVNNGIGLTLTNNVKKAQKVVKDAEDVVLMDIDIESAADVEVLDYSLVFPKTAYALVNQLEDIRVSVDGDEFDLDSALFDNDGNTTVDPEDTDGNVDTEVINLADKYLNQFSIDAGKKVNLKVLATTKADAAAGSYTVHLYIHEIKSLDTRNTIGAAYNPANVTISIADEVSHNTNVAGASLVVTPKSTDGNTIKIGETKDVVSFTAKAKSEDLKLKTLKFRIPATATLDTDALKDIVDSVTVDGKKVAVKDMTAKMVCYDGTDIDNGSVVENKAAACTHATYDTIYAAGGTWLEGEVTLNKTIKDGETATYTLSLKTAGDITAGSLGEKINVVVAAGGLYAKGVTSNQDVYNTTAAPGKQYQLVTTKPAVEVTQSGKYITVTVNNEADYNVKLQSIALNVLSERNDNGTNLLPAVTSWNIRENTTDGTILGTQATHTTIATNAAGIALPGVFTLDFTPVETAVAEGESATFVIEMISNVNIATTDYTVSTKSFGYKYRNEDATPTPTWGTQIDDNY